MTVEPRDFEKLFDDFSEDGRAIARGVIMGVDMASGRDETVLARREGSVLIVEARMNPLPRIEVEDYYAMRVIGRREEIRRYALAKRSAARRGFGRPRNFGRALHRARRKLGR